MNVEEFHHVMCECVCVCARGTRSQNWGMNRETQDEPTNQPLLIQMKDLLEVWCVSFPLVGSCSNKVGDLGNHPKSEADSCRWGNRCREKIQTQRGKFDERGLLVKNNNNNNKSTKFVFPLGDFFFFNDWR